MALEISEWGNQVDAISGGSSSTSAWAKEEIVWPRNPIQNNSGVSAKHWIFVSFWKSWNKLVGLYLYYSSDSVQTRADNTNNFNATSFYKPSRGKNERNKRYHINLRSPRDGASWYLVKFLINVGDNCELYPLKGVWKRVKSKKAHYRPTPTRCANKASILIF